MAQSFRLDEREQAKGFAAYLAQLERRIADLERSNPLTNASVDGGSLDVYDGEGSLQVVVGEQPDGTTGVVHFNGPPPPTPSEPVLASVLNGATATWDGLFTDADVAPLDFSRVEVHASPDPQFEPTQNTQVGTIESPRGATFTVPTDAPVYVCFLARNLSGTAGEASTVAGPVSPSVVVAEDVLDGIITETKLAEQAVTEAKIALEAVSGDKIKPGAVNDLILADDAVTQAKIATGAVGSAALADGAVLAEKLAKASVTQNALAAASVSLNALTGALGDSVGQRYTDLFRDPTVWERFSAGTGATWIINPDATGTPSGGGLLVATGDVQMVGKALIAQDTDTLYRVMVRVRATAQDPAGPATVYLGAVGVADDGTTLVNRNGAAATTSHYYPASSGGTLTTADGWKVFVGYIQGRVAVGANAPAGPNPDPRAPEPTHANVRFLRPTAWLNYGRGTGSVMEVDAFVVEPLRTGVVNSTNLVTGSVTAAAIATDAVIAGKVAADAITGREIAADSVTASEIAAGSVTAEKLTIVGGSNILPDPSFEGPLTLALITGLSYATQDKTKGNGSAASLKLDCRAATGTTRYVPLTLIPALPTDTFFLAADYFASTDWAGNEVSIYARWEDAAGGILGYSVIGTSTPVRNAWARISGTTTAAPAGTTRASIRIQSVTSTAGDVWFDNAQLRPVVPGVQIADGAITTPKMVANSIQGDRIAVGTLNGDRIVAGSVTTSQLSVTTAASVVQKLYDVGAEASKWRTGGSSTTTATAIANLTSVQVADAQSGGYVMRAVGLVSSAWRPDLLIPFDPNVLYRVSVTVRQSVAGSDTAQQRFYCGVAGVAADGTTLVNITGAAAASSQHYVTVSAQPLTAGAGWQRFTGYLKGYAAAGASGTPGAAPTPTAPGVLHANARYITPIVYANYQTGNGTAEIDMVTVEVLETGAVQTVNIADGQITAPKILAGAVTTDKLVALGVTAEKIASLAITTDKLAALSITADKMAVNSVTATAIAAGSIDATHIKVGAITADRLDANAINGKTITGAIVRTAASGARIVLDASRLTAYGSGAQRIVLEPSANPILYFTSDDGTNMATMQVGGVGSEATLFTNSGKFTAADSKVYRWRTYLGPDNWTAERVLDGTSTSSGGRLQLTNTTAFLKVDAGVSSLNLTQTDATLTAPSIRAAGVFRADNISTGTAKVTPTPNVPSPVTLSGGTIKGSKFRAFVTPNTGFPGVRVAGVGFTGLSSAGMTIWVTRTDSDETTVHWMIIGED